LTRFRAIALATVVTALAVWGTVAADLPALRESLAVAVAALVVLPAFTLAIWLALPLARSRATWLLIAAAAAGGLWMAFYFVDFEIASNISKLSCFVLVGLWFLSLFEFLWWLSLVALLVPWVDIWSVAFGPTRYVTEEQPQFFDSVSIALHVPGQTATANIGPPDIVFFALFLAAAHVDLHDRLPLADARPRLDRRQLRPARAAGGLPRLPRPERRLAVARRPRLLRGVRREARGGQVTTCN
jgi:hypothetical protein